MKIMLKFLAARRRFDSATRLEEPAQTTNGPAFGSQKAEGSVNTNSAPKPVGAYPHARRVGDLLYLSGVGPRQPGTNEILVDRFMTNKEIR